MFATALALLAVLLPHAPSAALAPAGLVGVPVANVRSGPGTGYPVITRFPKGMPVHILEGTDSWWRIQMPRQGPGWIFKDLVLLRPAPREEGKDR